MRVAAPRNRSSSAGENPEGPRDVVETVAGFIGRQQPIDIDRQMQQIANRIGVLRPVEAMNGNGRRRRASGGAAVEGGLEHRNELLDGARRRSGPTRRGHHAPTQLRDDFLPDGGCRINVGWVERIERQARGLQLLVVATDTVAPQELLAGGIGRRSGPLGGNGYDGLLCHPWQQRWKVQVRCHNDNGESRPDDEVLHGSLCEEGNTLSLEVNLHSELEEPRPEDLQGLQPRTAIASVLVECGR